ncbi:uncharacterized protein N7459_001924, partial [Penicillium hispanicum]|uniref:uncharacterized protein n=1 Tax=Penicillium hispanicum TaxID=1080232 RepID=UPI002541A5AA
MFEPCPGPRGSLNWIGARILEKKLAKITPKDWIEDQYFVCILLALAQVQEHKLKGPKPASYISRLMVTHALDEERMLFYEAEITAELLEVLSSPSTATTYRPWPTIRRKKIFYKPYNTFADRLMVELVAPASSLHKRSTVSDNMTKQRLEDESTKTYKRRRTM